jgi:hypothetical protein
VTNKFIFLLTILLVTVPCFSDLLVITESGISSNLTKQEALQPEMGAAIDWDTYNFISEQWSLFWDSLATINYNTTTAEITGEGELKTDLSYRTENFLSRLGVTASLWSKTNDEPYLDLIPELYLSYVNNEYTLFTSHKFAFLPLESESDFYEARLGIAFSLGTILNKPVVGLGIDLNEEELPLYLITEYDLSWYPDPFISIELSAGVHWYLSGDVNLHCFGDLAILWYVTNNFILTASSSLNILNSNLYSQPEIMLKPKAELGITITENSILSIGAESTIYLLESYLDEPSQIKFLIKFSYLF